MLGEKVKMKNRIMLMMLCCLLSVSLVSAVSDSFTINNGSVVELSERPTTGTFNATVYEEVWLEFDGDGDYVTFGDEAEFSPVNDLDFSFFLFNFNSNGGFRNV